MNYFNGNWTNDFCNNTIDYYSFVCHKPHITNSVSTTEKSAKKLMYPNDYLISDNGKYKLLMRSDGNLVIMNILDYYYTKIIWTTNTGNYSRTEEVFLQGMAHGQLRLKIANPGPIVWDSGTSFWGVSKSPFTLKILNSGNLIYMDKFGTIVWESLSGEYDSQETTTATPTIIPTNNTVAPW